MFGKYMRGVLHACISSSSLIDVIMVSTPDLVHESGTMTTIIGVKAEAS
jgi:hypothetical protein